MHALRGFAKQKRALLECVYKLKIQVKMQVQLSKSTRTLGHGGQG